LKGPSDVFLFLGRPHEFPKLQSMNPPKVRNECTNFQTLIATLSVLKRYDWVKHEDPSLLECYTLLTGAVTMLLKSVLPGLHGLEVQEKQHMGPEIKCL
jgi:hypothetical protein